MRNITVKTPINSMAQIKIKIKNDPTNNGALSLVLTDNDNKFITLISVFTYGDHNKIMLTKPSNLEIHTVKEIG